MQASSTKVRFRTRVSTEEELRNCLHVTMTSPALWDPDQVMIQETSTINDKNPQCVLSDAFGNYSYLNIDSDETLLHEIDPCLTNLKERMISKTSSIEDV